MCHHYLLARLAELSEDDDVEAPPAGDEVPSPEESLDPQPCG
ncbi:MULTISPECIES: hypothetical protein [unclassified Amycolatopsis]|nr:MULTISPECIES: hypothetical protein [unclassified Amycolatopsis]WSK83159.1 hypothetical protein OG570_22355 [Amycolatopsis sp. NBC_01286]